MIELYRGMVNTWECDEMGHMNVRFYIAKMMEGLVVFAAKMGMPDAFRTFGTATLVPRDQHIRFLNEVRPGQPIYMRGGVIEVTDTEVLLYQELIHANSGLPAATYQTWVSHVDTSAFRPFPWSAQTRERLKTIPAEVNAKIGPRSIQFDGNMRPSGETRISIPDELGVPVIGMGAIPTQDCDVFGRMRADMFIGRISDSVPNLMSAWREDLAKEQSKSGEKPVRQGAAVLEYRIIYRKWPRAGDLFQVRTGLGRVEEKVHGLVHWVMDPISGEALCTSEAVAVTFDLDTRKVIPTNPAHIKSLEAHAVRGLSI